MPVLLRCACCVGDVGRRWEEEHAGKVGKRSNDSFFLLKSAANDMVKHVSLCLERW